MIQNTTPLEEILKLNHGAVIEKFVEIEMKIEGLIGETNTSTATNSIINFSDDNIKKSGRTGTKYIVSVSDEIARLLMTPLGSRVMRPEYGSELYKLRDRELNESWRLLAIQYTFVAINRHIERVRCRKVLFEVLGDGRIKMKLQLEQK